MAIDIFRPEQWQSFFLLTGTGAVTLTGLVFVAMSINLKEVTKDATHRYRAIGTLSGFTAVFMLSALALMGDQTHVSIGSEWLCISIIAGIIFAYGYFQAIKKGESEQGLSIARTVAGGTCYVAQIAGSVLFLLNHSVGIYIASLGLILNFYFMVSGAWLLVVGVHQERLLK